MDTIQTRYIPASENDGYGFSAVVLSLSMDQLLGGGSWGWIMLPCLLLLKNITWKYPMDTLQRRVASAIAKNKYIYLKERPGVSLSTGSGPRDSECPSHYLGFAIT